MIETKPCNNCGNETRANTAICGECEVAERYEARIRELERLPERRAVASRRDWLVQELNELLTLAQSVVRRLSDLDISEMEETHEAERTSLEQGQIMSDEETDGMTLRERLREIAQRRISHKFADMAFVPEQLNRLAILFFIDQIPECEDTKVVRDALKNFRVQGWIE
jgi:hypothetical protein